MQRALGLTGMPTIALGLALAWWPIALAQESGKEAGPVSLPQALADAAARVDLLGDRLPPGAVARIGTARLVPGWSGSFAFSPDGTFFVYCGAGGSVQICEAPSGKPLQQFLPKEGEFIPKFALSPDGKSIATRSWSEKVIHLWDTATGKQLREFESDGTSYNLAFSPDGKMLAAYVHGTIEFLDTGTGNKKFTIKGSSSFEPRFFEFLPDGKTFVWEQDEYQNSNVLHAIVYWAELATGQEVRRHDIMNAGQKLILSAAANRMALLAAPDVVHVLNATTFEKLMEIHLGDKSDLKPLCFSDDGRILACHTRKTVTLFDVTTSKPLESVPANAKFPSFIGDDIALAPDGKTFALFLGTTQGEIQMLDTLSGKSTLDPPRPPPVGGVDFVPGAQALIASSWGVSGLYDPLTGKPLTPLQGPEKDRRWWTEEEKNIIVSKDRASVYEASSGRRLSQGTNFEPNYCLPNGKVLRINQNRRREPDDTSVIDLNTTQSLYRIPMHLSGYPLAISPDGHYFAIAYDPTASMTKSVVWDIAANKLAAELHWEDRTAIGSMIFTGDGKRLIAAHGESINFRGPDLYSLRMVDLKSGNEIRRYSLPKGDKHWDPLLMDRVHVIALSTDERTLAAGCHDAVLLWELSSGKSRGFFTGHVQHVSDLSFSSDGRLLASSGADGSALVWDMTGLHPDGQWTQRDVEPRELEQLWNDLTGDDGVRAYRAVWSLAAARQAPAFLAKKVKPTPVVPAERVSHLISELDNERYADRAEASLELQKAGEQAASAAHQALNGKVSLEKLKRLEQFLARVEGSEGIAERLSLSRVIEVLENARTAEALHVLEEFASGAPETHLTREAARALARLQRSKGEPK